MSYKGQSCPIKARQNIYLFCQEGDCSICYINTVQSRQTQKQLSDLKAMREAYR